MAPHYATSILTIFTIFITTARAQGRAPHGLAYEGPVAFSPSAVEFFHPDKQLPAVMKPCQESSACSPLPVAAHVIAATDEESKMTSRSSQSGGRNGLGAGGITGIVFGAAFVVFIAMGVFYVVSTRKANLSKASSSNSVQPEHV